MQVSVESPSKLERRLTVVVPLEKINEAFNKRIATLAKKVKLDGFRPGKVPLEVVMKRFGDAARQEALGELIQSSLYEAINQEKLNPVSTPSVEPKVTAVDKPLEFIATFEVLPEVESVGFTLKKIEKQIATVTDADIDTVLTQLRDQHKTWKQSNSPAKENDQVMIDFSGSVDGIEFDGGQAHDYAVVLGSKKMIPGFEEGILGMKAGEEKVITVNFPEDYFGKDVAGKKAEFKIKAIKVSHPDLPPLDDAFAKKLGIASGDIEGLRTEIRKNLDREVERLIKLKLKNQVFDQLLEQNPIEMPKALIERETKRIHDEVHPHHGHEHAHTDEEMSVFEDSAKRNVSLGLLLSVVLKEHKITADKTEVRAYLSNMASAYEKPSEVIRWYEGNKQAFAEIEMRVLEDKVIDTLLENVQVIEKTLSYNELINS